MYKNNMKPRIHPVISFPIVAILFALSGMSCRDGQETAKPQAAPKGPDTFTFFDVGKTSVFSGSLRRELSRTLGDDAIESKNVLDLEINHKGFLKQYFPDLDSLNQHLNFPPGERVEHRSFKLMYRYGPKPPPSFDYVELVFSEYTQTPVLMRIHFKRDDSNTLETLKQKYGPPETIYWGEEKGKSFYWRKNGDLLILSLVPDQFRNPEYRIVIYFKEELQELLKAEQAEKEGRRQGGTESGKAAF